MDQQYTGILLIVGLVGLVAWSQVRKYFRSKKVKEALEAGALVVDVRTAGEFGSGHYQGAINIPLDALQKKSGKLGAKDRAIVVYCASGSRSSAAAGTLKGLGFTNVLNGGALSSMPS